MTMSHSSRWLLLCAVLLAACGGSNERSQESSGVVLAATGSSGSVCGTAVENGDLSLACPAGQTITAIQFASYGLSNGSCGAFEKSVCDASNSVSIVSNACVGKAACSV